MRYDAEIHGGGQGVTFFLGKTIMRFGISMEIDSKASENSALVQKFSEILQIYFEDKRYGSGMQGVYVGFICVKSTSGYEAFFKARKPRYVLNRTAKMLDGSIRELGKTYSYDIKVPDDQYEHFVGAEKSVAFGIFKDMFLDSISNFDRLPRTVKDFDVKKFKSDLLTALPSVDDLL